MHDFRVATYTASDFAACPVASDQSSNVSSQSSHDSADVYRSGGGIAPAVILKW